MFLVQFLKSLYIYSAKEYLPMIAPSFSGDKTTHINLTPNKSAEERIAVTND